MGNVTINILIQDSEIHMNKEESETDINSKWEQIIKDKGADFVYFVDITMFPKEVTGEYKCAILFGKSLSKEYIRDIKAGVEPKHKEIFNTEQKMDALALKVAEMLEAEGYKSVGKLKTGLLPHKSVALRVGIGFIGKNNLLVTPEYGCAQMLGKVLTTAPFVTTYHESIAPQCGDCNICVDVCPNNALLGTTWDINKKREDIITRKLCTLCVKCMANCPFTQKYIK